MPQHKQQHKQQHRQHSRHFWLKVSGEYACFSNPDYPQECVSYEVMPPTVAKGLVECILWKPAISWYIHSLRVLSPICWGSKPAHLPTEPPEKNVVVLRDVAYLLEASFSLTDKAGEDDNIDKFEAMYWRRIGKQTFFQPPCLGFREFPARIEKITDPTPHIAAAIEQGIDRPLGKMVLTVDYEETPSDPPLKEAKTAAKTADGISKQVPSYAYTPIRTRYFQARLRDGELIFDTTRTK